MCLNLIQSLESGAVARLPDQRYITPPETLAALPGARKSRPKGPGNKRRRRWVDDRTGRIFEWDYQHGTVEMFDGRGNHMGGFDPQTGVQTKHADRTRSTEP